MGTIDVRFKSNDWETIARIRVIGDNRRVPITLQEKIDGKIAKLLTKDTSKNWKSLQIKTSFRQS